jgi:serine/threonine-protein kinase
VVDILEIIEDSGEIYLVFELLSGRNLRDVLSTGGRLALPKARDLFAGVAAAIDYAQSQGVIHRDLKPANVMLDAEGRPRVTDFGIARVTEEAVSRHCATRATTVVGTPLYMAPEQEQGATCTQSDVYSLAVCLYEALTGERPFPGTGAGLLMNKIKKAFKPPTQTAPGLPAGIDAVFDKALDPDPLRRHATAGDLMRDLAAL